MLRPIMTRRWPIPVLALLLFGCGDGGAGEPDAGLDAAPIDPVENWSRDILTTDLTVDVATHQASATITVAAGQVPGASFEVGDLTISAVTGADRTLLYDHHGNQLDVGVPASDQPIELTVDYQYQLHTDFDGADEDYTFLWPYYCGNLFPCHSDPADGVELSLALSGIPEGETAVYPEHIPSDAPSYMIAWAIGDYTYLDLGTTSAGTQVGAWYLPGGENRAVAGTAHLRDAVDWYETTYGAYPFGDRLGSVSVQWGFGAYGGMEHHPYSHVADGAMSDEETHLHEAAHGWFGDGIRIACWEDFVLSEGAVTYLAARATAAVSGVTAGSQIWSSYQVRLNQLQGGSGNKIAWPDGCGEVDILADGLFNDAPYVKGAYFFLALEGRIGVEALDAALAGFYAEYQGKAATMQDLLDYIAAETGYDPTPCALAWLRSEDVPADSVCPAAK